MFLKSGNSFANRWKVLSVGKFILFNRDRSKTKLCLMWNDSRHGQLHGLGISYPGTSADVDLSTAYHHAPSSGAAASNHTRYQCTYAKVLLYCFWRPDSIAATPHAQINTALDLLAWTNQPLNIALTFRFRINAGFDKRSLSTVCYLKYLVRHSIFFLCTES